MSRKKNKEKEASTTDSADMRDSFIFYRSFFDAIDKVKFTDQLVIFRAIAQYALNRVEMPLEGLNAIIWSLIKPQLDANWKRYDDGCKGGVHGVKGGNPNFAKGKSNPYYRKDNPTDNPTITPPITPNVNDNVNENIELECKSTGKKSTRFIPPTLNEVEKYISEQGYSVSAAAFVDFYESKGWKVGKNGMRDWKAAVRTWSRNDRKQFQRPEEVGITLRDNSTNKFDNEKLW